MFEDFKPKEFETHGESVGGVLNSMFSVKNTDWAAVIKFIFTLALFGWTVDSFLPVIHDSALWFFAMQPETFKPKEEFTRHFVKLIFPMTLFLSVISFFYFSRRRNLQPKLYEVTEAAPRKCLIYMLSTYNPKNALSLEDLMLKINDETLTLDEVLSNTNWGNLAFTVAFHAPIVEKCLIITTVDASKLFDKAEKLVKYIVKKQANRAIECDEVKIGEETQDANDIGKVANVIKRCYQKLESESYEFVDVVANITGGTSAMSGGMILATLAEDRNIEYIRQDEKLTEDLLKRGNIMLSPKTTYKLAKK